MKELLKKGFSPGVIIVIILIAVGTGGYYFFADPSGNEMRDESNELNEPIELKEPLIAPVGFEEEPLNPPTGDVQSSDDDQVDNPDVPTDTE